MLPPMPTGFLVVIGPCNVGPCQSLIAAVVGAKDGEKIGPGAYIGRPRERLPLMGRHLVMRLER